MVTGQGIVMVEDRRIVRQKKRSQVGNSQVKGYVDNQAGGQSSRRTRGQLCTRRKGRQSCVGREELSVGRTGGQPQRKKGGQENNVVSQEDRRITRYEDRRIAREEGTRIVKQKDKIGRNAHIGNPSQKCGKIVIFCYEQKVSTELQEPPFEKLGEVLPVLAMANCDNSSSSGSVLYFQ